MPTTVSDEVSAKLKLLMQRERELNEVRIQYNHHVQWSRGIHELMVKLAKCRSPAEALNELLEALINEFGFDLAVGVQGDRFSRVATNGQVTRADEDEALLRRVHEEIVSSNAVVVREGSTTSDTLLGWTMGGNVTIEANRRFQLIVGREARVLPFYPVPSRGEKELYRQLLSTLGHIFAAIEREALKQEMLVAREIQRALVPPDALLERPGLRFKGAVECASLVGGDFWTYAPVADGTLFMIGDVTGHGVGSGMITTVAKACLDTLVRTNITDLESVMKTMSWAIHESGKGEIYMTAFACIVHPREKMITWASAGHNPPLAVGLSEEGKLSALASRGDALGLTSDATVSIVQTPYHDATRLVLYTDGIVECRNPKGEPYGWRRFRKIVSETSPRPVDVQLHDIQKSFRDFVGTQPQADDVTVVVVGLA